MNVKKVTMVMRSLLDHAKNAKTFIIERYEMRIVAVNASIH